MLDIEPSQLRLMMKRLIKRHREIQNENKK